MSWSQKSTNTVPIPFDGTPFMYLGQVILSCHHGKDKNLGIKKKYREKVALVRRKSHVYIEGLESYRGHRGHCLLCPDLGLCAPYKFSHRHSDILMKVPLLMQNGSCWPYVSNLAGSFSMSKWNGIQTYIHT